MMFKIIIILLFNVFIYNYSTTLYILAVFVVNTVADFLANLTLNFISLCLFAISSILFFVISKIYFLFIKIYEGNYIPSILSYLLNFIQDPVSVFIETYSFFFNLFILICNIMFNYINIIFFFILNKFWLFISFIISLITKIFCLFFIEPLSFLFQFTKLNVIVQKIMLFYAYPHGKGQAMDETAETINIVRPEIVFLVAGAVIVIIWLYAWELIGEDLYDEDFDFEVVVESWYASIARNSGYFIRTKLEKPLYNSENIKSLKNELKDFIFLLFYPLISFLFKKLIVCLLKYLSIKKFTKSFIDFLFYECIMLQLFLFYIFLFLILSIWYYFLDLIIFILFLFL